jgi:alkylated DNA repair dioxygenase AlkB
VYYTLNYVSTSTTLARKGRKFGKSMMNCVITLMDLVGKSLYGLYRYIISTLHHVASSPGHSHFSACNIENVGVAWDEATTMLVILYSQGGGIEYHSVNGCNMQ